MLSNGKAGYQDCPQGARPSCISVIKYRGPSLSFRSARIDTPVSGYGSGVRSDGVARRGAAVWIWACGVVPAAHCNYSAEGSGCRVQALGLPMVPAAILLSVSTVISLQRKRLLLQPFLKKDFESSQEQVKMQNDAGEFVDLYVPRKCSASNRIIGAKDHASIQINIAEVDKATGRFNGQFKTYAICGAIRRMGEADDSLLRLAKTDSIVSKNF
ncbi:hypothetical protein COCON_G00174890 [Conger conger]|uniref:Small ribosomal subunit protein eS21 n=7 Tax=Teleostei TaxID=32443 RepID=A0A9Q1HRZ2_CONCO|nr:hypothetical protein COCON_G00174890 [Conger conger]